MGQLSINDFFWLDVQKIKNACKQAKIIHGQANNELGKIMPTIKTGANTQVVVFETTEEA